MQLPKNKDARKLFVTLFVKALNQETQFSPVSLFTEDLENVDDLVFAQALSLLRKYCVVYRSGPSAIYWKIRPMVAHKYKTGYYDTILKESFDEN